MRSGAADSSSPNADAADFLVYRLARWALNAPHGIAYVSYDSPAERTAVEARVLADVKAEDLTVERLDLSASTSIAEAIATLKAKIDATEADVLSVFGFGGFLRTLGEDWTPLNYRREEWFESGVRQIWWVPSVYDVAFARRAPDLYSWFLVRERLAAAPPKIPLTEIRPARTNVDLDFARQRSEAAQNRFRIAYSQKASLATLIGMVESAVRPLFDADAVEEARAAFATLLERLEQGELKAEWAGADASPELLRAKADLADVCGQNAEPLLVERLLKGVQTDQIERSVPETQAKIHLLLGNVASYHGLQDPAKRELVEALRLYKGVHDTQGEAHALWWLGDLALNTGDWQGAKRRYEDALPLFESLSNLLGYSNVLMRLGGLAQYRNDADEALRLYGIAASSLETLGNRRGSAYVAIQLGGLHLIRGELVLAEEAFLRAKALCHAVGDSSGYANAVFGLGQICGERGDNVSAHDLLIEVLPLYQLAGDPLNEASVLITLARIDAAAGRTVTAMQRYGRAMDLFKTASHTPGMAKVLVQMGCLLLNNDDVERAYKAIEIAHGLSEVVGDLLTSADASSLLAYIWAGQGQPQEAQPLWKAALREYETLGSAEMVGRTRVYLAGISEGDEREAHLLAARDVWTRAGREDLLPLLDPWGKASSPRIEIPLPHREEGWA